MAGTLGTRLATRDELRFVGRAEELSLAGRLFEADPPASVLHVHGPGGIGKSTLLREIARRGEAAGWTPRAIDGRDLPPLADALETALADVGEMKRPLVLFDTYERFSAVDGYLRRGLLPSLPESAIVVIAGRKPPERAWFQDGWENLTLAIELSGLSDEEAFELLAGQGLSADAGARAIVEWAKGSPLALAVAADTAAAGSGGVRADEDPEMLRALIRRLADSEVAGANLAALGVASIARVTTPALLSAVLDEGEAADAYEWLRTRTFAEPLGEGVTVHDLVRKAVRAEIRQREPEREREVRRRIADHLHARATQGRLILSIELAHLVDDPVIRWGYSWEGSSAYRIDDLRPGDAEDLAARLGERDPVWWDSARPFVEGAPERVAVARDATDRLVGYMIAVTPRNTPAFAEDDPLLGPWLAHARTLSAAGNAVLWHDSIDLSGDPLPRVQAMLGMAGILRSGLANPRYAYLPVNPRLAGAVDFSAALGARHLGGLDAHVGGHLIECHLLDYGPGGLLGMQRDVVYRECGFPPPGERVADPIVAEQVREALRHLGVPHELARNDLAQGNTPEERAQSVRALIEQAADAAFGDTPNERLLHDVLMRGYLQPAPSHELAAEDLNLSRATYFRRLKAAAERVADHIAAGR
ncbi:MAG: ATP-binding protein [Thermoleophilaceae bacterium]